MWSWSRYLQPPPGLKITPPPALDAPLLFVDHAGLGGQPGAAVVWVIDRHFLPLR